MTVFPPVTTMSTEFQNAKDIELSNIPNTHVFPGEILILAKGNQETHYNAVTQVLSKLYEANKVEVGIIQICTIRKRVAPLQISANIGIRPKATKTQAINEQDGNVSSRR